MTVPARHTGGLNVSDQDFFFDEDEKPGAKSGARKGSGSSKSSTPAARTASGGAATPVDAQSISLTIAILIAVIGVLLGVVVGLFIGKGMATPAVTSNLVNSAGPAVGAPQLTQDQLSNGQLPAGHPSIPGASTTPTKTK
jgi:hypothetical protein